MVAVIALFLSIYTCSDSRRIERKSDCGKSVSELVENLQTTVINFSFHEGNSGSNKKFTILQLDTDLLTNDNRDLRVFFMGDRKLATSFGKYEMDPFMPQEISVILSQFRVEGRGSYTPDAKMGYISITDMNDYWVFKSNYPDSSYYENTYLMSSGANAYYSFDNFIKTSLLLKQAIRKWIKENNANINLIEY